MARRKNEVASETVVAIGPAATGKLRVSHDDVRETAPRTDGRYDATRCTGRCRPEGGCILP
jgi:hypothetical protein